MLIAADTNVLMDLAAEVESVVDTLGLVRQRVAGARWVVLPAVIQELRFQILVSPKQVFHRQTIRSNYRVVRKRPWVVKIARAEVALGSMSHFDNACSFVVKYKSRTHE